jgi:hypothetical protein
MPNTTKQQTPRAHQRHHQHQAAAYDSITAKPECGSFMLKLLGSSSESLKTVFRSQERCWSQYLIVIIQDFFFNSNKERLGFFHISPALGLLIRNKLRKHTPLHQINQDVHHQAISESVFFQHPR